MYCPKAGAQETHVATSYSPEQHRNFCWAAEHLDDRLHESKDPIWVHCSACSTVVVPYVSVRMNEAQSSRVFSFQSSLSVALVLSCSAVSDSLWPHGLWPTRLLCPWDFPGKNIGMGSHFLFQGIFLTQGLNLCLLHWQMDYLPLNHQGSPTSLYVARSIRQLFPFQVTCNIQSPCFSTGHHCPLDGVVLYHMGYFMFIGHGAPTSGPLDSSSTHNPWSLWKHTSKCTHAFPMFLTGNLI